MRWLDGITDSMGLSLREVWEIVKSRKACVVQSMGSQSQRELSNSNKEPREGDPARSRGKRQGCVLSLGKAVQIMGTELAEEGKGDERQR